MYVPPVDKNLYVRSLRNRNIAYDVTHNDNLTTRIAKHRDLIYLLDAAV